MLLNIVSRVLMRNLKKFIHVTKILLSSFSSLKLTPLPNHLKDGSGCIPCFSDSFVARIMLQCPQNEVLTLAWHLCPLQSAYLLLP